MNFKPSDKVVCLHDFDITLPGCVVLSGNPPKKNVVYVVRDVDASSIDRNKKIGVGLLLVGVICNTSKNGREFCWCASCFRKLEEIQAENKLKREQEEAAALKEATQLINSEP